MTYGPQHEYVVALVDRARGLSREEVVGLASARAAVGAVAWDVCASARATIGAAACAAARDAARALACRHLISEHGFAQDHYATLIRPWHAVIGSIHPDDLPL